MPHPDSNSVQTGVWVFRLKAQQVTAVEVIRKAKHVGLQALASSKQLILAARHGGECLGAVLSHRLPRGSKFLDDIHGCTPLVPIASPCGIQLLRNIWRKRQGIDHSMR